MTKNIDKDIYQTIVRYFDRSKKTKDKNHRYNSWEHCYLHFSDFFIGERDGIDLAALHLGFYLASWGMYRGSSFLLQKDYKVHYPVVEVLMQYKHLRGIDFPPNLPNSTDVVKEIVSSLNPIRECYPNNNVTDTLATKIMLGTLGCVPAYDEYFKKGVEKVNQSYGLRRIKYSTVNESSLLDVVGFYGQHEAAFSRAQGYIKNKSDINQPAMKLVDMYFWEVGFNS